MDDVKPKSTELAPVAPKTGNAVMAFVPKSPEEIKWVIGMVVGAGLAPDSYGNDQKKMAVGILKGLEIGVPPLTALSNIAIINGRPSIWGDLAMALVQRMGVIAKVEEVEVGEKPGDGDGIEDFKDSYGFEVRITRKGQEGPWAGRFTVGDAKRAKLWMNPRKGPWMQYPLRMLKLRARAYALRDGFADCLAGMSIREEAEDIAPPAKDVQTDFLDDTPAPEPEVTTTDYLEDAAPGSMSDDETLPLPAPAAG